MQSLWQGKRVDVHGARPGACCPTLARSSPVTRALASRSWTQVGSVILQGTVPVESRRALCSVNIPKIADPYRFVPPADPDTRPGASDVHSVLASLVVLTMNCGGAGQKAALILSLLEENSTDVPLLQELWGASPPLTLRNPTMWFSGMVK